MFDFIKLKRLIFMPLYQSSGKFLFSSPLICSTLLFPLNQHSVMGTHILKLHASHKFMGKHSFFLLIYDQLLLLLLFSMLLMMTVDVDHLLLVFLSKTSSNTETFYL